MHFILWNYFESLTLLVLGGGRQNMPCDAKFSEECPCSHNNNTALVKQIYLVDTALVNAIKKYLTPLLLEL